ncbi:Transcription termination/antitermination protein NusA [subsurface metagenome]
MVIWSQDTSVFIANALSPAQVVNIGLNEEEGVATVIVPDRQLSLAIGKEGQNVRLAAKLSGWRIDVKGASTAEAERIAEAKPLVEEAMEIVEEGAVEEELPAEVPATVAGEEAEPSPVLETPFAPPPVPIEGETQIRFAEDILVSKPAKPGTRTKKKKKKKDTYSQKSEDGIKTKKPRRGKETPVDEDEEGYEY